MRIKTKYLLSFDILILVLGVLAIIFSQTVGDFIHPTPYKEFYQNIGQQIDSFYEDVDSNKLATDESMTDRIISINSEIEKNSLTVFNLDPVSFDPAKLDGLLKDKSTSYVRTYDFTIIEVYLGEAIREKTNSLWSVDDGGLLIKGNNGSEVRVWQFLDSKLSGVDLLTNDFIQESVEKLK